MVGQYILVYSTISPLLMPIGHRSSSFNGGLGKVKNLYEAHSCFGTRVRLITAFHFSKNKTPLSGALGQKMTKKFQKCPRATNTCLRWEDFIEVHFLKKKILKKISNTMSFSKTASNAYGPKD